MSCYVDWRHSCVFGQWNHRFWFWDGPTRPIPRWWSLIPAKHLGWRVLQTLKWWFTVMINSDHRLAGPVPGQGLPVVQDLDQKLGTKFPGYSIWMVMRCVIWDLRQKLPTVGNFTRQMVCKLLWQGWDVDNTNNNWLLRLMILRLVS